MTPFQLHVHNWRECTRCPLHKTRHNVVISRGKVPAEVVFIGEGPGASEDVIGTPFVGPAGHLLDDIILRAGMGERRFAVTNLIACMPYDPDEGKIEEPPKDAIKACAPRLKEFVRLCKPRLIVLVGQHAQRHVLGQAQFGDDWLPAGQFIRLMNMLHPAAILKGNVAQKGLSIQRCITGLAAELEALDELF